MRFIIPFFMLQNSAMEGCVDYVYTWNFYSGSMLQVTAMQRVTLVQRKDAPD